MTEPPAEPLPAVSGFLSQAESSTIGSAARAEIYRLSDNGSMTLTSVRP